jgi:hypothetical protein
MNVQKLWGIQILCAVCCARHNTRAESRVHCRALLRLGLFIYYNFPFGKRGCGDASRAAHRQEAAPLCICAHVHEFCSSLSVYICACNMNAPAARARPNINRTSTMPFGAGNNPVTLRILCYRPPKTRLPPRRPVMNEKRIYYRPALCALLSRGHYFMSLHSFIIIIPMPLPPLLFQRRK